MRKRKKKSIKKSYSKLKEEYKNVQRLYIQESKNHKQNNILYNEQIERLESQLMDFRKQNNQLLIQLSQLSNEIIYLRKKCSISDNKIEDLEKFHEREKFVLNDYDGVNIDEIINSSDREKEDLSEENNDDSHAEDGLSKMENIYDC